MRKDISATGDRTAELLAIVAGLGALVLLIAGGFLNAFERRTLREGGSRVAWASATLTFLVGLTLVELPVANNVGSQNEQELARRSVSTASQYASSIFDQLRQEQYALQAVSQFIANSVKVKMPS